MGKVNVKPHVPQNVDVLNTTVANSNISKEPGAAGAKGRTLVFFDAPNQVIPVGTYFKRTVTQELVIEDENGNLVGLVVKFELAREFGAQKPTFKIQDVKVKEFERTPK